MEVEMKMVKSLLLGTAAGLVAVAGAQAADMPVKAAPVAYVKICSLYGDGFYYVPGTATCIKFGGYVRLQTEFNSGSSGIAFGFGNGLSASLAAEDPGSHFKAGVVNDNFAAFFSSIGANGVSVGNNNGLNAQGGAVNGFNNGFRAPDLVANVRIDQAWGFIGTSAVMHEVAGSYYTATGTCAAPATPQCVQNGHPADHYGYAVAVGGLFNLPGGDAIGANFVY